ncbi:MAG: hypothetical protein KR126chlam1_00933 [Chlamydiae bacterium]|nr:hypothetical protein [Chlamydiota bacterium]
MTPPAYHMQADALYFQTREGGNAYALKENRVLSPKPKYRLGVRIKAAATLCHDNWQVWLTFLHYHARVTENKQGEIFPTWGHPLQGLEKANSVRSRWRLHLGFLDLNLARCWEASSCISLTPYWGLRFAGVRHKTRINYLLVDRENELSMKNKFWGLGPQFGAEALWKLNRCFSLFSRGACSLLFGEFYIHQDEEDPKNKDKGQFKLFDTHSQTRKAAELALGLEYCHLFEEKCIALFARIGWEAYLLFHQNQLYYFPSKSQPGKSIQSRGSLALYGWSFGLGVTL